MCDEGVVRDHDGGREDGGGHQHGVAVDLLHGEGRGDERLLQAVSVTPGQQKAQGQWNKVKDTDCVCVCAYRVWEIPMLHWEGWEVTLLV